MATRAFFTGGRSGLTTLCFGCSTGLPGGDSEGDAGGEGRRSSLSRDCGGDGRAASCRRWYFWDVRTRETSDACAARRSLAELKQSVTDILHVVGRSGKRVNLIVTVSWKHSSSGKMREEFGRILAIVFDAYTSQILVFLWQPSEVRSRVPRGDVSNVIENRQLQGAVGLPVLVRITHSRFGLPCPFVEHLHRRVFIQQRISRPTAHPAEAERGAVW